MVKSGSIYKHVPVNDPQLLEFSSLLSPSQKPVLVPVIDTPGPNGNSYWNVAAAIKKVGGKMSLGWEINRWPGCFLVATHHAVLMSADGELFDVTARSPVSDKPFATTFLPDNSITIDIDKSPSVPSRFFVLNSAAEVSSYIRTYENLNASEKALNELLYECGYRCETNKNLASGINELTPNIVSADQKRLAQINDKTVEQKWIMKDKIMKLMKYSDALA